jgi:hypothetical protein
MKKIKLVDGNKLRSTKDIDFGVIGRHEIDIYVPENEIWFDRAYLKEKEFIFSDLEEHKRLVKKYGYEKAKAIERKKMPGGDPKMARVKLIKTESKMKIVLVDGPYVRQHFDSNFFFGGHPLVYDYVPKGEIWIDNAVVPEERPFVIAHEVYEYQLMKKGMSYSNAHDYACAREKEVRRAAGAKYLLD